MNASPQEMLGRAKIRLGNYEPLIELAAGGMATVYVARQVGAAGFERLVVVKRVHRHHLGNREFYRMFVDEARVASLVRHPNVVSVIDTVELEGELFLVMEYVESLALSVLLKTLSQTRERIPAAIACRIMADTLAGLHAAHEAVDMRGAALHIVHRDVSPQNIVVGADGTSRLIDFGVAKAAHRLTETRSGSLKGKLAYMSPEQALGGDIDQRVDIFAAGVALHEALTGRRLFQGENDLDTMRRITEMAVPDPSALAPDIPKALDAVVQRALMRDPNQRFQTAALFLDALEAVVLPASSREVATYLQMKCGAKLEERRARLREIAEGRAEPLTLQSGPDLFQGLSSGDGTVLPPAVAARRRQLGESESGVSQISQIIAPSTRDASLPPQKQNLGLWIGIGAGLAALFLVVAIVGAAVYTKRKQSATAASPSAVVVPPPASSPGQPPTRYDEVQLTVRAEAPLVGVYVAGARRVEIVGDRATVVVPPWKGNLTIDAILEGNRPARAVAEMGGSRDLWASTLPTPGAPSPSASEKPRKGTGPAGPPRSELQDNPYQ